MRHSDVTSPKKSLLGKIMQVKKRSVHKFHYIKNMLNGSYSSARIDLSWDGKPKRYDLINDTIKRLDHKSYLEIGCFKDSTLHRITCRSKIGVDPKDGGALGMKSDEFFAQNKEKFDCIFIDGLHDYSQVLKDIRNALGALSDDGTILIDEVLPLKYEYQTTPQSHMIWNGDGWKAMVEVRTWPDVDTALCLIDHGIGIIKKRPNSDALEINTHDFKNLHFKSLANNYRKWMNAMEYAQALEFIRNV